MWRTKAKAFVKTQANFSSLLNEDTSLMGKPCHTKQKPPMWGFNKSILCN